MWTSQMFFSSNILKIFLSKKHSAHEQTLFLWVLVSDINTVFYNTCGIELITSHYAVNWYVSRWNGLDTMDVIFFSISRPAGLACEKV